MARKGKFLSHRKNYFKTDQVKLIIFHYFLNLQVSLTNVAKNFRSQLMRWQVFAVLNVCWYNLGHVYGVCQTLN
jgi:hypothetical protein